MLKHSGWGICKKEVLAVSKVVGFVVGPIYYLPGGLVSWRERIRSMSMSQPVVFSLSRILSTGRNCR